MGACFTITKDNCERNINSFSISPKQDEMSISDNTLLQTRKHQFSPNRFNILDTINNHQTLNLERNFEKESAKHIDLYPNEIVNKDTIIHHFTPTFFPIFKGYTQKDIDRCLKMWNFLKTDEDKLHEFFDLFYSELFILDPRSKEIFKDLRTKSSILFHVIGFIVRDRMTTVDSKKIQTVIRLHKLLNVPVRCYSTYILCLLQTFPKIMKQTSFYNAKDLSSWMILLNAVLFTMLNGVFETEEDVKQISIYEFQLPILHNRTDLIVTPDEIISDSEDSDNTHSYPNISKSIFSEERKEQLSTIFE